MKAKKILALLASMSLLLVAVLTPAMSASADDVESPAIYSTDEVVLEDFNDMTSGNNDWSNRAISSTIDGVHGGAIQFTGSDGTATLTTPWDMSSYVNGNYAFKLRIYAEDDYAWPMGDGVNANTNCDWNIYFGNNTANPYETSIDQMPRIVYGKGFYLQAGWNEVYLPIVASCVYGGSLSDLDKITHVRMYDTGASGDPVWLDEISIVSYTPAEPVYDATARVLYLDRAEDMSVYMDRRGMYNDNNNKEGNAAVFSNGNWLKRSYTTPGNAGDTTVDNGALKFWLYVADADALNNLWFQIHSGDGWNGGSNKAGLSFENLQNTLNLTDGWNEITLKFKDARAFGTAIDLSAITYTHLEWSNKENTRNLVGIDDMRIVNLDGPVSTAPEESTPEVSAPEVSNPEPPAPNPPVTDEPTFTADKAIAKPGETITVAIRTKNNPGIVSFMVQIGYDAKLLELVSIKGQDFAGVVFGPLTDNPIAANWCDSTHPNNTTDGVVALLTFRVKEDAPASTTPITLSYDPEDVFNYDLDNVTFETVNGSVVICPHENTTAIPAAPSTCIKQGNAAYTVCNECGKVISGSDAKFPLTDHVYDNACDAICNTEGCGNTRTPADHVYDNACDADCNVCGATRTPADHVYDNVCDTDCNVCGDTRTVPHVYDNACDATCNTEGCGVTRTPADHVYDNACDADCNVCGATRIPADHVYDNACDADCNVCGDTRTPADHVYDNACDADCNVCGATRIPADHVYNNACDADCNVCGDTRIPADHVYNDTYDPSCNECGDMREVLERPANPVNGAIFTVDNVTARAGETITVAIRAENNPGIVSFMLQIGYDAELLELVSIEEQDFAGVVFGPQTNNPIAANWCDSTHPNNTTDGVVALLTFRVKEDAPVGTTAITLSYDPEDVYDYDMNNVMFGTKYGAVEIIDYIPGDVNDDGNINNKDLSLMQRYISGWDVAANTFACDVNGDGNINNKDLSLLQRYISGWDIELQ